MSACGFRIYEYELPLVAPLELPRARLTSRGGLLVYLTDGKGAEGWGDVAPLPGFSRETLDQARDQVLRELPALAATPACAWPAGILPSVSFGVESARLMLEREGSCLAQSLRPDAPHEVPVSRLLTRDAGGAERMAASATRCAAIKIKVGTRSAADDAAMVRTVAERMGTDVGLRLDANRRWTSEQAEDFVSQVSGIPFEYIEEPLADRSALLDFAERTHCPLALDESLAESAPEANDPLLEHVRAFILKPTLLGGWSRLKGLIATAATRNIQTVVSACFETGVGLWHLGHLASAMPGPVRPAGIDTWRWLASDVLVPAFTIENDRMRLDTPFGEIYRVDSNACRLVAEQALPTTQSPRTT